MESKLSQLLNRLKRYGTINNEDIPILIQEIEHLQASEQLAWLQLKQAWERIEEEL